jgi:hypothetical protein
MMAMFAGESWVKNVPGYKYFSSDDLDGIDIEKEYNLIKQKKSNYSRSIRDRIVYQYERMKSKDA